VVGDKWLELLFGFLDVEPSEYPCADLAPVELPSLSPSVGLAGKSGSTWEWLGVDDKWLEFSSKSLDVVSSEFPWANLVPVELSLLSSSVGSAAGGGGE
jgi:hypothetical protein